MTMAHAVRDLRALEGAVRRLVPEGCDLDGGDGNDGDDGGERARPSGETKGPGGAAPAALRELVGPVRALSEELRCSIFPYM